MRFLLQKILAAVWWLLNFRALRLLALLFFLLWSFDCAMTFFTDAAWFSSLGFGDLFWQTRARQLGFSLVFFAFCLASAIPFLRAVARPLEAAHGARSFPRALDFLGHWHGLAPKLSWLVVLVFAFVGARNIGNLAAPPDSLLSGGDSPALFLRFSPRFWLFELPFWDAISAELRRFFFALFLVLALGGGVRALPFLASKTPQTPHRWLRALMVLGVFLLVLWAFGYATQIPNFARGDEFSGFEALVLAPLSVLGIVLCALASLFVLRRAKRKTLFFGVLAALFLPAVFGAVLRPFFFWLPSPPGARKQHENAFVSPPTPKVSGADSLSRSWPIWDENLVLGTARGTVSQRNERQIEWRRGALFRDENGAWHGAAVGNGEPLDGAVKGRTDAASRDEWLSLELTTLREGSPRQDERFLPVGNTFFGLGGPPLWSENPRVGVPFRGFWALAWAWRLRAPHKLLESGRHPRLVIFRGTTDIAQRLAPEFLWTNARPLWHENRWWFYADGYAVSADFPNVAPRNEGFFAGQNTARHALRILQNPLSGEVRFYAMNQTSWPRAARDFPVTQKKSPVFPNDFERNEIEKLRDASPEIWTNRGRLATFDALGLERAELEKRLGLLDARALRDFSSENGETLQNATPIAWQEGRQWWIGRAYFAVKRNPNAAPNEFQGARLWRVALTQNRDDAPLGFDSTAEGAQRDFRLRKDVQTQPAPRQQTPREREIAALRALESAEKALREGQTAKFGSELQRARKLLEDAAKSTN